MNDENKSTEEAICQQLQKLTGKPDPITGETNIVDEFALDSIKVLDLVMEIEDEFDISIPINVLADVETVNDLAAIIDELR